MRAMPTLGKTLSQEEAIQMAQSALNPLYEDELKRVLDTVNTQSMARGFFGQAPWAANRQQQAALVNNAKASALSQYAHEMMRQSMQDALAQQQMQMQWQLEQDRLARTSSGGGGSYYDPLDAERLKFQQKQWEDELKLRTAELTGIYNGMPTMSTKQNALNYAIGTISKLPSSAGNALSQANANIYKPSTPMATNWANNISLYR